MTNWNNSSGPRQRATKAALIERSRRHPGNLRYWTEAHRIIGGRPMVIPPAWWAIYEDDHPFIVVRKPSQVGATEFNIDLALHAAETGYAGRGVVLVTQPTQEMVQRISQSRFGKAINESPYLRRIARPDADALVRGPASVQRRAVGPGLIYFTGIEQETQYSGIDADVVIVDEFDLAEEATLGNLQPRLRSSRAGRMIVTSTPTIESFGVSRLYEASDGRRCEMECPACGTWQTPIFPDSIDRERMTVVCVDCRGDLDPWRQPRWVATRPSETAIHGYQLNRLVLPNPPLAEMFLAFENKILSTTEDFHRQDLGKPYVSEDARLSLKDLDDCVDSWQLKEEFLQFSRCVMGVDVGKRLHVVIRGLYEGRWYLHKAFTCTEFEELDPLLDYHNISACVVDSQPETRMAKALYERHPGEVALCRYTLNGLGAHWDHLDGVSYVKTPRTLAIDSVLHSFKSGLYALPANYREIQEGEYVDNLLSPVRVQELDAFGHPVATYKHVRPDDFAHAEVYASLAMERGAGLGVVILTPGSGGFQVIGDASPHRDLQFRRR